MGKKALGRFKIFHVYMGQADLVYKTDSSQEILAHFRSYLGGFDQLEDQYHYATEDENKVSLEDLEAKYDLKTYLVSVAKNGAKEYNPKKTVNLDLGRSELGVPTNDKELNDLMQELEPSAARRL